MTRKFTVPIVLPADPAAAMEAATKQYVDTKGPAHVVDTVEPSVKVDGMLWTDPSAVGIGLGLETQFGGTQGATNPVVATTYGVRLTATFVKPAHWTTYALLAWADQLASGDTAKSFDGRLGIGGNYGTVTTLAIAANAYRSLPVRHTRSGLTTDSVINVEIQRVTGSGSFTSPFAILNFIAAQQT